MSVIPFITHGDCDSGSIMAVPKRKASRSRILEPLVMQADQEKRTLSEVTHRFKEIFGGR